MKSTARSEPAEKLRDAIERYLRDCYARLSPPRVDELACVLGLHPVVVRRRVQRLFGTSASRLVKVAQLRFACDLLRQSTLTVGEIADRAAFGSRRSFLRAFRRELGQSPAAFRSTKMSLDSGGGRADVEDGSQSSESNDDC